MAVKDLAIFKLFGSVFKIGKDYTEDLEKKEPDAILGITKKTAKSEEKETENDQTPKQDAISKEEDKKELTEDISSEKVEAKAKSVRKTAAKKSTVKKSNAKKAVKKTSKKAAAGSKKEAKIKLYTKDIKKHLGTVDDEFLAIIVKNLGPSIYRKDAELVSCSDAKELDTVRKNFLIKKLGFDKDEKEMLDGEIQKVCETLKGVRTKYRATFYYMLAKNLNKESALS